MASKVQTYKGYRIVSSGATIVLYSSGRAGKVKRRFWVEPEIGGFGVVGKWFNSVKEAKAWINAELKGTS